MKIILTTFTDPMMGLSYECEPVYEQLEKHFGDRLVFNYVMSGLVRDVTDFMSMEELALPIEDGIAAYLVRLAAIYKSEESIGNLPINMEGFHLFDAKHRSSYPLNIAVKACELCDRSKANQYLYCLRRATLCQGRQTTKRDELVRVACEIGLDRERFVDFYDNGAAEQAFADDLAKTRALGIRSLPACQIEYGTHSIICSGMIGFEGFRRHISDLLAKY